MSEFTVVGTIQLPVALEVFPALLEAYEKTYGPYLQIRNSADGTAYEILKPKETRND